MEITNNAQVTHSQEIGLKLPDGTEIYPPEKWHGRTMDTVEGRENILATIRHSAANLGMEEDDLLDRYSWVTCDRTTVTWAETTGEMPIQSTGMVGVVGEFQVYEDERIPPGRHHLGSLPPDQAYAAADDYAKARWDDNGGPVAEDVLRSGGQTYQT